VATRAPIDIQLDAGTQRVLELLKKHAGAVSLKNALRAIGISYRKEVGKIFDKKQVRDPSLKWPDLAASTIAAKKRLGYGDMPMMQRTRDLRTSMTNEGSKGNIARYGHTNAEFGSTIPYGNFHDNLNEERTKLPLRNFSQPSVSTYGSWINTLQADLTNQLKAIGVSVT
jgi:hypothetical protein